MATSGLHGGGQILGEDSDLDLMKEWPLTYVRETKECVCGWCGQALVSTHNMEDIETHFKSCKSSKDNGLSMIFKGLRKMDQKMERLGDDVQLKVEKKIAEVKAEMLNIKTEIGKEMEINKHEFKKEILDLKSEIKNDLEMEMKSRDEALPTLFWKVKALEEKMAEVTETISTAVHSILEAQGSSSAESALLNELDRSKKEMEALSERLKTTDRDLRVIKTQLEDEKAKKESSKRMSEHVETSSLEQSSIPMNCFNLVSHNYLFRPSFRWTIAGIDFFIAQKTFELSSHLFQWNGYPVRARAKFRLNKDDCVYMSLSLEDDGQLKDFKPIPQVFYMLKDKFARNPSHICSKAYYLSGSNFSYWLEFAHCLVHKSWLNDSSYKVKNSVEIEIYVEPFSMTQLVHSYDGTLEWNIENYSRRLQLEKDGLVPNHESPYFYTSERGFRVQVGMYFKGAEGGRMMTARIEFLTGKFDADLPKSFPHSTTVTLVNRKDPKQSLEKTIVEDTKNEKYYDIEMCKVEEVEQLVENDTLYCKVSIKAQ